MSEIRKQKIIKREKLTWAPPCAAQPAGRPSQQAAQPTSLLCRLRPRQREGSVAGARARHRATPPLSLPACPPLLARCPGRRHASPPALSHSPSVPPSSPSLSLSRPNTTIAAARHNHGHRASLAPPTSPEAPPRPPLPLHQATRPRTPCIAAHVAVPLLGHRRSSPFDSPPTGRPRAR